MMKITEMFLISLRAAPQITAIAHYLDLTNLGLPSQASSPHCDHGLFRPAAQTHLGVPPCQRDWPCMEDARSVGADIPGHPSGAGPTRRFASGIHGVGRVLGGLPPWDASWTEWAQQSRAVVVRAPALKSALNPSLLEDSRPHHRNLRGRCVRAAENHQA